MTSLNSIVIIIIISILQLSHREASCSQITKLERVAAGIYTRVCVTPNSEPSRAPHLHFSLTRTWGERKKTSFLPVSLKWWPNEWLSLRAGYSSFTKLQEHKFSLKWMIMTWMLWLSNCLNQFQEKLSCFVRESRWCEEI